MAAVVVQQALQAAKKAGRLAAERSADGEQGAAPKAKAKPVAESESNLAAPTDETSQPTASVPFADTQEEEEAPELLGTQQQISPQQLSGPLERAKHPETAVMPFQKFPDDG